MERVREILVGLVRDVFGVLDVDVAVTEAPSGQDADYASNVAFVLAGKVGKKPREVAEALIKNWPAQGALGNSSTKDEKKQERNEGESEGNEDVGGEGAGAGIKVEVAGAGFLNFTMGDEALIGELRKFGVAGHSEKYKEKVVVTEFSDPNPFKVLHVGHLYTSIVGDAISRLVEYAGGEVHRVNFGGDVGLHVAKTMWAIQRKMGGKFALGKLPRGGIAIRMNWIADRYVEGTRAYEEDEGAKEEIIELNKAIYKIATSEDRKSQVAKVYWKCRGWSYEYFESFYGHIGVKFERYYPESTVAELGLRTVKKHVPEVYEESDGAIVFRGEKYGLHTRVFINAQGLPTYEAKDVGLLEQKWKDYKFDESVVITGADITEYMKVVLKSVEQYDAKLVERTRHIVHGNVILPGAVKMSSRKGNFLRAIEVLDMVSEEERRALGAEARRVRVDMVRMIMAKMMRMAVLVGRRKGASVDMLGAVVAGAVRYAFLKSKIGADNIVFDLKESVNLHGNSGPYLQYALVRAKSILRKKGKAVKGAEQEMDEWEKGLLKKILAWEGVVQEAVEELAPHKVCGYLYELAQTFSRFYENDKVIGGSNEALRLELVRRYAEVLEGGLRVLGIPVVEKM